MINIEPIVDLDVLFGSVLILMIVLGVPIFDIIKTVKIFKNPRLSINESQTYFIIVHFIYSIIVFFVSIICLTMGKLLIIPFLYTGYTIMRIIIKVFGEYVVPEHLPVKLSIRALFDIVMIGFLLYNLNL